jgi:hypothetical protein
MVLLDSLGGIIHATIQKTLIYKFKDEILEGKIYALQNVGVSNNGGAYRTTRHPYTMNFQLTLWFKDCLILTFQNLHFTLFQSLKLLGDLMILIIYVVSFS